MELDPSKFLHTKIICGNEKIKIQTDNKMKRLHAHWTSKIPERHKRNAIISEIHRTNKFFSNFYSKIKRIVNKYIATRIPTRFVCSIVDNFNNGKNYYSPMVV